MPITPEYVRALEPAATALLPLADRLNEFASWIPFWNNHVAANRDRQQFLWELNRRYMCGPPAGSKMASLKRPYVWLAKQVASFLDAAHGVEVILNRNRLPRAEASGATPVIRAWAGYQDLTAALKRFRSHLGRMYVALNIEGAMYSGLPIRWVPFAGARDGEAAFFWWPEEGPGEHWAQGPIPPVFAARREWVTKTFSDDELFPRLDDAVCKSADDFHRACLFAVDNLLRFAAGKGRGRKAHEAMRLKYLPGHRWSADSLLAGLDAWASQSDPGDFAAWCEVRKLRIDY